ncbi:MAG: lactate racemase domain-containing protein [Verrucomicrobiota bacterium]|jgi:nickel-dependent lactate racemase
MNEVHSRVAAPGMLLGREDVAAVVAQACPGSAHRGKRVLLVIPDSTRTAPIGMLFRALFDELMGSVAALDILVALGTHRAMTEEEICVRLEITREERQGRYGRVQFFNHEWDNPAALKPLGVIPRDEIHALSGGLFAMDVPVTVNRRVDEYDRIIIVGPVFPHEVVGFSGGNKYLFPGIGGAEVLNFFHWLGAVITTVGVIGNKWTPVRRVVDRAGAMVRTDKLCLALVVANGGLAGVFAGTPEAAWDQAVDESARHHIVRKPRPFHTILSCAPAMYDELWVGAKCMYKLEPVLAEGGELIIYAPHLKEVSWVHGRLIRQVGYHCRDYFLQQWDRFKDMPWGVLAHSTHVFGQGTYVDGIERARARVTLATGIPEDECRAINLGYRRWQDIRVEAYQDREAEGVLHVPKAGETLYRLEAGV